MFALIKARVVAHQRKQADAAIQELREDADTLGLGPPSGPLRVALRMRYHTGPLFFLAMVPITACVVWFLPRVVNHLALAVFPAYMLRRPSGASSSSWPILIRVGRLFLTVGLGFLFVRRVAVFLGSFCELKAGVFLRLSVWAKLIHQCAEIVRAPRIRDGHYLASVHFAVTRVYGARAMRGTAGFTVWRRRKAMREHAFAVADALRAAESKLDVEPKEGAREIARLAMKISIRYAEGRVGALLDESDLADVRTSGRRFEAAQLVVAVVGAVIAALGVPALDLPVQVAVAASVLAVAAVYRNAVFTGLGGLASLYPLLFPGK
ncbi:hypothetical protein [Streptomyces pinistramenti]|uniref:hypothetical protein n=1 Tax=Streptomyces pinistramenti TaxID=2884812 RepID=UPI001D06CA43|nr:hypothetical protein [Streptomyces pinistramenti]MCB5905850.1 hypothetical protein [Streptomyces pinistramenti]